VTIAAEHSVRILIELGHGQDGRLSARGYDGR
jgi:hypothetical protein